RRPAEHRQPERCRCRRVPGHLRPRFRARIEPQTHDGENQMTVDVARSMKKMFVDGRWVDSESGKHFEAKSPATGETIAQVPQGTRAAARKAIEAPHRARPAMASLKGFERSKRLHRVAEAIGRRREELGRILTLDQGKPLVAEALVEVDEADEYFAIAA